MGLAFLALQAVAFIAEMLVQNAATAGTLQLSEDTLVSIMLR
jgi:hypothetical protein